MKKIILMGILSLSCYAHSFEVLLPEYAHSPTLDLYCEEVFTPIYNKVGIKPTYVYLEESEINRRIKSGEFDALGTKISNEALVPNSIPINYPIVHELPISLYKLKGSKTSTILKVGSLEGDYSHQKTIIENKVRIKSVIAFKSIKESYSALKKGEVDAILINNVVYDQLLSKNEKKSLSVLMKNLKTFSSQHYLHIKHKDLSAKIKPIFQQYHQTGKLDYIKFLKKKSSNN